MSQQQNAVQCPNPCETLDFHFKLLQHLKIYEPDGRPPPPFSSVVAVAKNLGIFFVGTLTGFKVLKTKLLSVGHDSNRYPFREVLLGIQPTHLCINCDQNLLAVGCFNQNIGCQVFIYNVAAFSMKDVNVIQTVRMPSPEVGLCNLVWNPGVANLLSCCQVDGSIGLIEFKPSSFEINHIPPSLLATCLCWSPKGKQLVVGTETGMLTQYKPNLKAVKSLPPPALFGDSAAVVSLIWLSSYQFAAAYRNKATLHDFPVVMVVNAVKNDPVIFINYDDITYSNSLFRKHEMYFLHQTTWNMMLVSSSNSMEVAVLSCHQDGLTWQQLLPVDASRAELPLNANHQETFPVGVALDTSCETPFPWGETLVAPPPLLLILSNEGVLSMFHVVNVAAGAQPVCVPPQITPDDSLFTVATVGAVQTPSSAISESAKLTQPETPTSNIPLSISDAHGAFYSAPNPAVTSSGTGVSKAVTPTPAELHAVSLVKRTGVQSNEAAASPPAVSLPVFTKPLSFSMSPHVTTAAAVVTAVTTALTTTADSPRPRTPEAPVVDDSVYLSAIQDEMEQFAAELRALSQHNRSFIVDVGTQQDKDTLRIKLEGLSQFSDELKETTEGLSEEVHAVKEDLMETFSWLEEAKSHNRQRKNPNLVQLRRSEDLDPVSERDMKEVSRLKYYVENQLKQLNDHLDREWARHQDGCREDVTNKMLIPSMENVYKTIHLQLKILHRQRALLEELKKAAERTKTKAQTPFVPSPARAEAVQGTRALELSKLADSFLQIKITGDDCLTTDMYCWEKLLKTRVDAVAQRTQRLTEAKKNALRDALCDRDVVKIRPAKPSVQTSAFVRYGDGHRDTQAKPSCSSPRASSVSSKPASTIHVTSGAKEPAPIFSFGGNVLEPPKSMFSFSEFKKSNLNAISSGAEAACETKSAAHAFSFSSKQADVSLSGFSFQSSSDSQAAQAAIPINKSTPFAFSGNVTPPFHPQPVTSAPMDSGSSKQDSLKSQINDAAVEVETRVKMAAPETLTKFAFTVPAVKGEPDVSAPVRPSVPASSLLSELLVRTSKPSSAGAGSATANITSNASSASSLPATSTTSSSFSLATSTTSTSGIIIPTPTAGSIFGASATATPTTGSIFGASATATPTTGSIFGTSASTTTTSSIFGAVTSTPTASSIFGARSTATPTAGSIFGTGSPSPTTGSIFGANTSSTPTTGDIFNASISTPTTGSIFGDNTTSTPTTGGIFGASTTATPTTGGIFGDSTTSSPTTGSIFGTSTTSTPTAGGIFGSSTTPTTSLTKEATSTMGSMFGSVTIVTVAGSDQSSATVTPSTATAGAFNQVATAMSNHLFAQAITTPAQPTTASSVFGQVSSSTPTSTGSMFGQSSPANTPSIFGQAAGTSTTTSSGIFGQLTATPPAVTSPTSPTSASDVFGHTSPSPATTPSTGIFAQAAASFGQKTDALGQTTNLFGQLLSTGGSASSGGGGFGSSPGAAVTSASSNIFAQSKSLFDQNSSSVFGSKTTTSGFFGGGSTSAFPASSTTTSSFGAQSTTSSGFAQAPSTTTSSFFAQNICSPFSSSTVAPNQNPFGSSTFGVKQVFGQPPQQEGSIFGGSPSAGSVFGGGTTSFATSSTSTFGTPGPFSGGQSSVAQSGFGSPPAFQKSPAFGSSPVFGSLPTNSAVGGFGGSPTFSNPTFGTQSAFGSPSKVFGSPTNFGQAQPQSTAFENIGTQNTVGFGNLAQQNTSTGFGNFGTPTNFRNTSSFGGNSFSTWR